MSYLPLFLDPYSIARVFLFGGCYLDPWTLKESFTNVPPFYHSFRLPFFSPIISASFEATTSSIFPIGDRSPKIKEEELREVGEEIDNFIVRG